MGERKRKKKFQSYFDSWVQGHLFYPIDSLLNSYSPGFSTHLLTTRQLLAVVVLGGLPPLQLHMTHVFLQETEPVTINL